MGDDRLLEQPARDNVFFPKLFEGSYDTAFHPAGAPASGVCLFPIFIGLGLSGPPRAGGPKDQFLDFHHSTGREMHPSPPRRETALRAVIHEVVEIEFVDENDVVCLNICHVLLLVLSGGNVIVDQAFAVTAIGSGVAINRAATLCGVELRNKNCANWERASE